MIHFSRQSSLLIGTLLVAAIALPCHADVRYTSQMTMGAPTSADAPAMPAGMTMPAIRTTTYVKDMHERVETSMEMGPIRTNTVTLTLCDEHQSIRLDPALKIYTVAPIGVMSFGVPPSMNSRKGKGMPEGKPGVGTVTTTFSVQDLGTEKVAQIDKARHFKLTVRNQTTGCIGQGDTTFVTEEWVAPIKAGLSCPERYAATPRTDPNDHGCQITYTIKGDMDKLRDIASGMVVRMIIYGDKEGTKVVAQQDLRDYSTAALDDALFTTPADYKEVSAEDFQKQESDAMRKAMMGGLGAMFKPPTDDANGNDNGNAAPPAQDNGDQTPPPAPKKKPKFKIPGLPF
ncbi:MAG: hypothetical protein M3Y28_03910 [Armatimonadota bacterium]|nr:hypothetical protein [Armatimonadota bacterium]